MRTKSMKATNKVYFKVFNKVLLPMFIMTITKNLN